MVKAALEIARRTRGVRSRATTKQQNKARKLITIITFFVLMIMGIDVADVRISTRKGMELRKMETTERARNGTRLRHKAHREKREMVKLSSIRRNADWSDGRMDFFDVWLRLGSGCACARRQWRRFCCLFKEKQWRSWAKCNNHHVNHTHEIYQIYR